MNSNEKSQSGDRLPESDCSREQAPPDYFVCAGCGETSAEWGHYITEDCIIGPEDSRIDMIGEYECNHCGSQKWINPRTEGITMTQKNEESVDHVAEMKEKNKAAILARLGEQAEPVEFRDIWNVHNISERVVDALNELVETNQVKLHESWVQMKGRTAMRRVYKFSLVNSGKEGA